MFKAFGNLTLAILFVFITACGGGGGGGAGDTGDTGGDGGGGGTAIKIVRIKLGLDDDVKPSVVKLRNGELMLIAFHSQVVDCGKKDYSICIDEQMIMFRTLDGGRTWTDRKELDIMGREGFFSITKDGTLFVTSHLRREDIENDYDHTYSFVNRSSDNGRTWEETRIMYEDYPSLPYKTTVATSRNVLELKDGTLILAVSAINGYNSIWKSKDKGKTWSAKVKSNFVGVDMEKVWWCMMCEAFLWEAKNGDILAILRVDPRVFPLVSSENYELVSDTYMRMVIFRSKDGGENWRIAPELGSFYGEMYPSILKLHNKKLLLTFTVRDVKKPFGIQAVLGEEKDDGFEFDFGNDRIILLSQRTEYPAPGGFGPTVQTEDGSLVTVYSYHDKSPKVQNLGVLIWRLPN